MTVLVAIGGGHELAPAPAESFLRAVAAGCPNTITSSYRDPVEQQRLRSLYLAGKYDAYVAPVEKSEHVIGNALDLKGPAISWMRLHPEYGWVFTDPSERWHVAYRLDRDQHLGSAPPLTPITQEDDMYTDADRERDNYIRAKLDDTFAKVQNVESILATEKSLTPAGTALGTNGGMRAEVRRAWADVGTIANELRSLATQLGVKKL